MATGCRIACSGNVNDASHPSGWRSCSRSARSHVVPRATSTTRPRITHPALEYEIDVPGAKTCGSAAQVAT